MKKRAIAVLMVTVFSLVFIQVASAFEIREPTVCLDVQWGRAVHPMTIVRPNNDNLYFHAYYSGNEKKRTFIVKWNRLEGDKKLLLCSNKIEISHKDGHIDCRSKVKDSQRWQEGKYLVELWEDDKLLREVPFEVIQTSSAPMRDAW